MSYLQMHELVEKLNKATEEYDKGCPIMTDKEWDNLYFQLIQLEREAGYTLFESPTQKVSYTVVNELKKIEHNHKMLSLDKTKNISDIETFAKNNKLLIAMCKMDGLTCSLRYLDGKLVSAETRGNGYIGEDILHNTRVIPSIPKYIPYLDELIIDGEIICPYNKFEPFSKDYKNPRNFAAGSIRLLDSRECELRNLKFIAWDVIKGLDNHISHFKNDENETEVDETVWFKGYANEDLCQKLNDLGKIGFTIVPYITIDPLDDNKNYEEKINVLKDKAKEFNYPIDGIVFKFDNIEYGKSLGETAHHFKNAIAYKFYDETYDTRLKYIEWSLGRTGVLTPVAVFESVDIDGTTVERASLHNYGVMRETLGPCAYKGEPIKIYKANQIIPQVEPVEEEYRLNYGQVIAQGGVSANDEPECCPICGGSCSVVKSKDGILNMMCDNPECQGKFITKLDHFVGKKGLDIKGLSKVTLEKLIDWGYINNLVDIFKLFRYINEWKKQDGFGEKSVTKILEAIEKAKNCTLESFISSLGIPLIGSTNAKDIAKIADGDYKKFRDMINSNYAFYKLPNFGEAKHAAIMNFDYTEADELVQYLNIIEKKDNTIDIINKPFKGQIFVITGKLYNFKNREQLEEQIKARGGKISSSVSAKTTYLINNDISSNSNKNVTAKKLGVSIITEEELVSMF